MLNNALAKQEFEISILLTQLVTNPIQTLQAFSCPHSSPVLHSSIEQYLVQNDMGLPTEWLTIKFQPWHSEMKSQPNSTNIYNFPECTFTCGIYMRIHIHSSIKNVVC